MNHKKLLSQMVSFFLVVLVSAACGAVQLLNHPAPQLTVATDWLEKAGCTSSENVSGWWQCTPASPLRTLGCENIEVYDLVGGLSPSHPLVRCVNSSGKLPNSTEFKERGCMQHEWVTYVLFKDNTYQLVSQPAELQTVFAPVESADEALSYALAATNLYARYGQEIVPYFRYLVDQLGDTHVDETAEGYLVHLFESLQPPCGCGVHTADAVDVLVTRDGQVTETNSQPVYEFDACID